MNELYIALVGSHARHTEAFLAAVSNARDKVVAFQEVRCPDADVMAVDGVAAFLIYHEAGDDGVLR